MNENLSESASFLTVEEQLTLLKDSIDLRFTHKEDNEFALLSKADAIGRFEYSEKIRHTPNFFASQQIALLQEELAEQAKNKRSIRYICCMVIWLSLFTPFLNTDGGKGTLLGLDFISALFGTLTLSVNASGWVIVVALFPILLILYGATLALFPEKDNFATIRTSLWAITAGSGIIYFFAALAFFATNSSINEALSTIGFGYYLAMIAIFAYHFLTQLTDSTSTS